MTPSAVAALFTIALLGLVSVCLVEGSKVLQCQGSKARQLEDKEVEVTHCASGQCKLKRKTTVGIVLRFTPDTDVKELTTTVYANVLGLPLPFIGVDGMTACDKLFAADGETAVSCPLKAGTEYVYKNSFPVLQVYPKLTLVVHWALTSRNQDVVCFELPAKII